MRSSLRWLALAVVVVVLSHMVDGWAWRHLASPDVYAHDLGRMLRVLGFLPLWLIAALALFLQTRHKRFALFLAFGPALAGLAGEALKLLIRRERPNLHEGAYVFRPFAEQFWSSKDFGMPSSHACVAFGGAWILCRLYPRASAVWLLLAAGTALTRVQAQAHFVSDVAVGAVVGVMVAELLWSSSRVVNRES